MKAIYSELYCNDKNNNGYCLPTFEIEYTDNEKNYIPKSNNMVEVKEDDCDFYISYVSFFNTFFDGLKEETISKIKTLFDFAYKYNRMDYVNKDIWKPFLFTTNIKINNTKISYNTHLEHIINNTYKHKLYRDYNKKSSNQIIVERYYNNTKSNYDKTISDKQYEIFIQLSSHFSNNLKPSLKKNYVNGIVINNDISIIDLMKKGLFGGIMNIDYEFEFNSELELLYTFLNIIFSSEYNFKIKKCHNCNNYYITLNTNSKHCSKCLPTIKKLQKQNYENKNIKIIERRINQLFYAPNRINEKDKYIKNKNKKKKELVNGIITEDKYIDWLKSHYRTK